MTPPVSISPSLEIVITHGRVKSSAMIIKISVARYLPRITCLSDTAFVSSISIVPVFFSSAINRIVKAGMKKNKVQYAIEKND